MTNKWRRAEIIFGEKKLVHTKAEGTQVTCIADPRNGVLLNVATIKGPPRREEVMGNETREEEPSQNVCNLEHYAEEKVLLSSKKRTVNVLSTGCLLSGFCFVFSFKGAFDLP